MNFTSISNKLANVAGRTGLQIQKQSPHILFGAGVVGFVGTTVLASRATLKLDEVLTEIEEKSAQADRVLDMNRKDYGKMEYQRDRTIIISQGAMKIVRLYAPTIVCGALTLAAFTGSHTILTRRNAALTAAYAAVDRAFKEYRGRVVDEMGEEADLRFRHPHREVELETEGKDGSTSSEIVNVPDTAAGLSQYAIFFGRDTSPEWEPASNYNEVFLNSKQSYFNHRLRTRGHVFLNEVYEALGFPHTKAGSVVGWVRGNGDDFVDFGLNDNNREGVIDFLNQVENQVWLDFNVDGVIYDLI